ncbi:hypothetical protein BV20DRAFT_196931 [Pilatotrama ljubarskyi]|nr:hypothetical protein BV20DRAFT_196931 [Pilatotrama ljubarskyi]
MHSIAASAVKGQPDLQTLRYNGPFCVSVSLVQRCSRGAPPQYTRPRHGGAGVVPRSKPTAALRPTSETARNHRPNLRRRCIWTDIDARASTAAAPTSFSSRVSAICAKVSLGRHDLPTAVSVRMNPKQSFGWPLGPAKSLPFCAAQGGGCARGQGERQACHGRKRQSQSRTTSRW